MLIDPNTLRDDGTAFVGEVFMSEDGNKAAYMVSLSGSDWKSIYVKWVHIHHENKPIFMVIIGTKPLLQRTAIK